MQRTGVEIMASNISQSVQKYRASLRALRLRLVQIWLPDTRRPGFAEECHRQSRLMRDDTQERDTLEWWAAAADESGWK